MACAVSEALGQCPRGTVASRSVHITRRGKPRAQKLPGTEPLPPTVGRLEFMVVIDERWAAAFRLRDAPRAVGGSFIRHPPAEHQFQRIMLVSEDHELEVRYLAKQVGITEMLAEKSPEEKLTIVRVETSRAKTLHVGDGRHGRRETSDVTARPASR